MTLQFKQLLVPIDFGEPSQCALEAAIELARRFDGQLTLVHVYEIPSYVYGGMTYSTADLLGPIREAASESLDKALREVQQKLPTARAILRQGSPAVEVLGVIDEARPDLVVIGTHGRKGVRHALLGSVAEKVVRLSAVPVLTMHGSA
ncbi:MAG TPA: universal stress protein [Polyangiaceae bacterium]|jgi:nucleotide-binding universal stress UspA family protein